MFRFCSSEIGAYLQLPDAFPWALSLNTKKALPMLLSRFEGRNGGREAKKKRKERGENTQI